MKLTSMQMVLCAGVVFIAGMVRGFSGFALSALIMASVALILPPIELIPVCYILEAVASLIMFRGGVRDADMKVVWGLSIGLVIGFPMGLYATNVLPVETSKLVVLCIILILASAQLLHASPKGLTRTSGLYATGVMAGIVTGLAHVGGMVVAPVRACAGGAGQNHAVVSGDVSVHRHVHGITVPAGLRGYEQACIHPGLAVRPCCHGRCVGGYVPISPFLCGRIQEILSRPADFPLAGRAVAAGALTPGIEKRRRIVSYSNSPAPNFSLRTSIPSQGLFFAAASDSRSAIGPFMLVRYGWMKIPCYSLCQPKKTLLTVGEGSSRMQQQKRPCDCIPARILE